MIDDQFIRDLTGRTGPELVAALEAILPRVISEAVERGDWPLIYGAAHCAAVLNGHPEASPFRYDPITGPVWHNPHDQGAAGRGPAERALRVVADGIRDQARREPVIRSVADALEASDRHVPTPPHPTCQKIVEPGPGGEPGRWDWECTAACNVITAERCWEPPCVGGAYLPAAYETHMREAHGIDPRVDDSDPRADLG